MPKSNSNKCSSVNPSPAGLRLESSQGESDDKSDLPDLQSLEYLHSDAQRTLDSVIETNNGYATKALGLIRMNGLVLTILIALSNQSLNGIEYFNWLTGIGAFSFFVSTILSVHAYFGHDLQMGVGKREINETIRKGLNNTQYLTWILYSGYSDWLVKAQDKIDRRAHYLEWATISFTAGIIAVGGIFIQL